MTMKTSRDGIELIKKYEGCYLKSYRCPAGVLTIGVGHTSAAGKPDVLPDMKITQTQADEILTNDLRAVEADVERLVKVPLSQNQFDVLVSFTFNCGAGALEKSTLLKRVNDGKLDQAPAELMKYTRGGGKVLPGLVARRRAEALMWRGIDASAPITINESRATPDQPVPSKTIAQSKEGNAAMIAGGASAVSLLREVSDQAQNASDAITGISSVISNPTALVLILVCVAAAAIWFWRKQRLDEEAA